MITIQEVLPTLVSEQTSEENHLPHPWQCKLFHAPVKPDVPPHIGAALQSTYRREWLDYLYNIYDRLHRTSTLSSPFAIAQLPAQTTILR